MKSREKIKEETLTELYTKKTSPNTLKIQKAKTAQCQAVLLWDSINAVSYTHLTLPTTPYV